MFQRSIGVTFGKAITLIVFAFNAHSEEVTPCGHAGERACCFLETDFGACHEGLAKVDGCDDQTFGDCKCGGLGLGDSVHHCVAVTSCGAQNQRACCLGERAGNSCDAGLFEMPFCEGDCLCAGDFAFESSGTCVKATPCGGKGQRACCIAERNPDVACDEGLTKVPGCSGDCFCNGTGARSSDMCADLNEAMVEPGPSWAADSSTRSCPLRGYMDMHLHLLGHTAHGGGVVAGMSYDPINGVNGALRPDYGTDLALVKNTTNDPGNDVDAPAPTCPSFLPNCGSRMFHGDHTAFDDSTGFGTGDRSASNFGAPTFGGWPTWHTTTHQQVYYRWLERAWRGGLRLITMLASTNETLCRGTRHLKGVNCFDSMATIDAQLAEIYRFQTFMDSQYGGEGNGWFRIVTTPLEARRVISQGKMAVVLGIEVDNLFNCKYGFENQGTCSEAYLDHLVDVYYDLGVRHIFPIHNFDTALGSPATWQPGINVGNRVEEGKWWDTEPCPSGYNFKLTIGDEFIGRLLLLLGFRIDDRPPFSDDLTDCNKYGLTPLGKHVINKLMDKGYIIDIDHMSNKSVNDTLDLAEQRNPVYPIVASHALPLDMQVTNGGVRHERLRSRAQLDRIRDGGGMVALMLKDNVQDMDDAGKHLTVQYDQNLADDCRHSSKSWAQSYLYLVDVMGGPIAMGSDFNGAAGHVGPRFGSEACGGDFSNAGIGLERSLQARFSNRVSYPFTDPEFGTFDKQVTGQKTFDYNVDGMAHIGLLPDFVQDLRVIGLTNAQLDPLFTSAEGYIKVWERASNAGVVFTPPAAACKNILVDADQNCKGNGSIAANSLIGNDSVALSQTPAGPFDGGTTTSVRLDVRPTLSCTDATSCTSNITVVDKTPPPLTCPATQIAECTGASTTVNFTEPSPGADNCGGASSTGCLPLPGSNFTLGTTSVTCSAKDTANNTASCNFDVVVQDTTKPTITAPADRLNVECTSPAGASTSLGSPTTSDACDASLTIANNAPSVFPPRVTTNVTWTATDHSGNSDTAIQRVRVVDTSKPVVTCSVATPLLTNPFPPNHNLINVGFTSTAADLCDGTLPVTVTVFANEDDQIATDKKTVFSPDAANIATSTLRLRQERYDSGNGRIYLIVSKATDASGNVGANCCTAVVPHDNNANSIRTVQNAAAAVRNACMTSNGTPPATYFRVGDGPVIGSKQ